MKEILALTFRSEPKDIKTKVYRETLKYIVDNLPNAEVYNFVNNQSLLNYIKSHKFSLIISTNEIACDTAFLFKGMGLVHILVGMRDDLLDVSDIVLDPLVKRSEKYLVGTKYLLPSIVKKFKAKTLAEILKIDPSIMLEEINHNDSEIELLNIAQVCQKLEWDSDFFEVNIGYISSLRLTPNIEKYIRKFICKEKIDLLEYLCNCHDRESVITSEENGYSFVDIRLTFERFLNDGVGAKSQKNYEIRKGKLNDIKSLKEIATDIYRHSRYYFDINFDRNKVIEFYRGWAEKAIRGQFDDFAYVLYNNKTPIGFCTIKRMRRNTAKIGLFGMKSEFSNKGLAKYLLDMSLQSLKDEGINYVEVVTQGRNYAAQRLYQKSGFITKSTELWYHKWFR